MYPDENGYLRTDKKRLFHRQVAYHEIYKPNRSRYWLPFPMYVVHHIDRNKLNNHKDNLLIVTPHEHNKIHGITKERTRKKYSNPLQVPAIQKTKFPYVVIPIVIAIFVPGGLFVVIVGLLIYLWIKKKKRER